LQHVEPQFINGYGKAAGAVYPFFLASVKAVHSDGLMNQPPPMGHPNSSGKHGLQVNIVGNNECRRPSCSDHRLRARKVAPAQKLTVTTR